MNRSVSNSLRVQRQHVNNKPALTELSLLTSAEPPLGGGVNRPEVLTSTHPPTLPPPPVPPLPAPLEDPNLPDPFSFLHTLLSQPSDQKYPPPPPVPTSLLTLPTHTTLPWWSFHNAFEDLSYDKDISMYIHSHSVAPPGVIILGMHRSLPSLLTGLLTTNLTTLGPPHSHVLPQAKITAAA